MRKIIALVLSLLIFFVGIAGCIDEGKINRKINETSEVLLVEVTDSCTEVCSSIVDDELAKQEEKMEQVVEDNITELENKFANYLILYQQIQDQQQGCLTEDQIFCILWEFYQQANSVGPTTPTFGCFTPH